MVCAQGARVRRSPGRGTAAVLGCAFLYAPVSGGVAYSFCDSVMKARWAGFSLEW